MAATIPEGGTYLDTFKKSFTAVPINEANGNAIATTEFLEAAESLTTMFGKHVQPTMTNKNKIRFR